MAFYEALRTALSSYERFVHVANHPATSSELQKCKQQFSAPIPSSYEDFLSTFNGARLFHESIQLFGTNDAELCVVQKDHLRIGEIPLGTLWMNQSGQITCLDESDPDPILIGSSLERFLEAMIAREALLIDHHGEFRDVFDEDGEISPSILLKQSKAGQKKDPGSAFFLYEQAEIDFSEGNQEAAISILLKSVSFDPYAAPCIELLASLYKENGNIEEAERLFAQAARVSLSPSKKIERFGQAALASSLPDNASLYVQQALTEDPSYPLTLFQQLQELLQNNAKEAEERMRLLRLCFEQIKKPWDSSVQNIYEQSIVIDKQLRTRTRLQVIL